MATPKTDEAPILNIPETMKAVAIDKFGPPEVIKARTLPVPQVETHQLRLEEHEVLIAVRTAGVGIWDAKIREGTWAEGDEKFPLVLGTDGAGIVAARGSRVRNVRVGDRVWAYEYSNPKGGFYAEYVVIDAEHVGHAPKVLDWVQAGAAMVTGLTALQGVDHWLGVRAGQEVLIFGASGAVGTLAVQFAKYRGARVIGTASGEDAARLVKELGADAVIDPRSNDVADRLKETAPRGLDAVLALAGGEALEQCIELVRQDGRVAYPNGVEPDPRLRHGIHIYRYDAVAGPLEFERLERAANETRLRVPIEAVYPLEEAAKAHERIEQGHVLGRIVLRIGED